MNDSFEEILNLLDIWIYEGSGWIIDKIEGLFINVANYEPLLSGSYISLPKSLNNSMKGLINLKNKDHKCFMWCHVRLINSTNSHPERINKQDKTIASTLDYRGINFRMKARDYEIIKEKFEINVNVFGYENNVFPLYVSKNQMNKF